MTILEAVQSKFAEILEIDLPDPDTDIYDLGGDSAQAVQIALELEVDLGVAIPLETFEEDSTPRAVAAWIERKLQTSPQAAAG